VSVNAEQFIDPPGPWSPDTFGDSDSDALTVRLNAYLQEAKTKVKNLSVPDDHARADELIALWVLHLGYKRLVTKLSAQAATESQPEYSRTVTGEQIRTLTVERDKAEQEFGSILAGITEANRAVGHGRLVRV
jgi:hypothetical protein